MCVSVNVLVVVFAICVSFVWRIVLRCVMYLYDVSNVFVDNSACIMFSDVGEIDMFCKVGVDW